ncbi:aspartate ammonia-lyase [Clostridium acetobutylicum]|uniref:aspartate ammonia-lyase n=1 Tax=Clostridium acetobutylicum (strain ATCC 824 / DSM 792 / JCM 1419 / IAM 19013 / LMG 5710 / NBRC 13948 / NRRL B-527 / VKM B-1787 / 2291 / W) TaxID=272562 RepID=Q97II9_CLOAB|nr:MULTISPECIES: aspartate ammonia-lyase [Clostridium]AAK79618.1 Aspartate ammonia-lyase [Clostridium acetobutylicum ATCC 824]ADZ20702.1 aspartate ammonia-lyase [Clostridium acetobutylicum EA 2018]AEI34704.1 aspartate ammonia-lyase [Clostridium acetobutylicum DSM 1731]AWV79944.1 aspartate ammonia-lyase [Clostridium acetobutylicum]MBC2394070.1 aspartate ammonia-lyase [Clostridium acetobutylicum]
MFDLPSDFRIEKDLLGEKNLPKESYYGINSLRAFENFNISNKKVNLNLIYAVVIVKKAAALAHKKLKELKDEKADAIISACDDILSGKFDDEFITNSLQGGAGTSTNMNVNEVIANRAIELLNGSKGDYSIIHPIEDVNMSQSTNDVYPTALRIAAIKLLRPLSDALSKLQESFQIKENDFSDILMLGRTELMDALPMMVGQGFGAYAKAFARDRWRIYKVEERLREINIGGNAIGTGINASYDYIFTVTDILQDLTGLGLARSDYPMDVTQNMDVFVEVSGLLKSCAVNLIKISNDIRLLNSGPVGGIGEFIVEEVQAGSSIMPGKVNPVICEMTAQTSMKVMANDTAISLASSFGQLQLNAFSPLIAESLLESLEILTNAVNVFREKCIDSIKINEEKCLENLEASTALVTALVHYIGYDKASIIAKKALKEKKSIRELLLLEKILTKEEIDKILNPYEITKPGIPGL